MQTAGSAPEWIHILPSGTFKGADGRGPYVLRDPQSVITRSMEQAHGKLALDENHATDTAAKIGLPAHAMGWIAELDARPDGIWGRVEWTPPGKQAMANLAYRGISPVFDHTRDGVVTCILRASLTNDPNLTLTALHHKQKETRMDLAEQARALGLPEGATQADVDRAFAAARSNTALHTNLAAVLGLDATADGTALLTGVKARLDGDKAQQTAMHALQQQVADLQKEAAQAAAAKAVDDAASEGRVISKDMRAELIALHTTNPEMAGKIIAQLPKLPQGQIAQRPASAAHAATVPADAGADDKALAALDATFKVTAEERKKLGEAHAY